MTPQPAAGRDAAQAHGGVRLSAPAEDTRQRFGDRVEPEADEDQPGCARDPEVMAAIEAPHPAHADEA